MSSKPAFVFNSAPSLPLEFDTIMPCYECSMLSYDMRCQNCSRLSATTPMTPPPSPASFYPFSFEFASSLTNKLAALEFPYSPELSTPITKQSRWDWPTLDAAKLETPSSKRSRFDWSELSTPIEQYAIRKHTRDSDTAQPSASTTDPAPHTTCSFCTMVPYGALCTKCSQIQTSKAMTLATPPAAAWPVLHRLGDWEGTKAAEEELLQNLDMELFEQINVPHELDEWGRRVYNDCGHRILYYQDSDGNTVMGYEAWFPCSVAGDYEESDDWRWGGQMRETAADKES